MSGAPQNLKTALYFGCTGNGHYLHAAGHTLGRVHDYFKTLPWSDNFMDTGPACPRCGSGITAMAHQHVTNYFAAELMVCGDCGAAWEPFDIQALSNPTDAHSMFTAPCSNCAFRPGSRERRNRRGWRALFGRLTSDPYSRFDCHKGVPINLNSVASEVGFDYAACPPRPCAGWGALRLGIAAKALRVLRDWRRP